MRPSWLTFSSLLAHQSLWLNRVTEKKNVRFFQPSKSLQRAFPREKSLPNSPSSPTKNKTIFYSSFLVKLKKNTKAHPVILYWFRGRFGRSCCRFALASISRFKLVLLPYLSSFELQGSWWSNDRPNRRGITCPLLLCFNLCDKLGWIIIY